MAIWLIEVLYHGWAGLGWLTYFHFSLLLIPFLFFVWLSQCKIIAYNWRSYLKLILLYAISFIILLSLFILVFITGPGATLFYSQETWWTKKIYASIIPVVLVLVNFLISKILNTKFSVFDFIYLTIAQVFIFVFSGLICMLVFTLNLPFNGTSPNPFWEGLDPIEWFKSGSVILTFMIYEGLYLINIGKRNPTTVST